MNRKKAVNNSNHSKKKATPGPKAERLKLKGKWRDLLKKSRSKKAGQSSDMGTNKPSEPRLVIVPYFQGEPAMWECSACCELFSILSVDGVYAGFKEILAVFQKQCRAEHPIA